MDRKKIVILIGILVLALASLSIVKSAFQVYLPGIIKMQHVAGTPDPCAPSPYPIPTPVGCPTATPTYNPYPPPATQTPGIITATPKPPLDKFIYIPLVK
jgi:hypothetical protein